MVELGTQDIGEPTFSGEQVEQARIAPAGWPLRATFSSI
jgi:hypothetical protein